MLGVRHGPLVMVDKGVFPVTVDYGQRVGEAWSCALRHVRSHGNISLDNRVFPNALLGRSDFQCRYAVLQRDDHLGELENLFESLGLHLADMMQFFAFVCRHMETEVTAQNPSPIVAASPCSTWRCSHEILREMPGVYWDPWYHNPGPCLHTESESPEEGFRRGTRFLVFE